MPKRIDLDVRKAQLATAVWQIILDRGLGAVSVRTVADQAGVVVGSLRHVFPTRAELIAFSAELMVERASARIRATPRTEDTRAYVLAVLTHLLPLEADSRAELEINIALIAESTALPALVDIRDNAYRALGEACLQLVELLAGRPRDEQLVHVARRLHALVDGLALHLFLQPLGTDSAWALAILADELNSIGQNSSPR